MQNEGADIIQETPEQSAEWKRKAKEAGVAAKEATRAAYSEMQDKTMEYTKATDHAIRENPYAAVGIAFGIGCLFGFLITRGGNDKDKD